MFKDIAIIYDNITGEEIIHNHDSYSNIVTIPRIDIRIEPRGCTTKLYDYSVKFSNQACFSKNNLYFNPISISSNGTITTRSSLHDHQIEFIKAQINIIDNLIISSEIFLEYAHFRKAQLLNLLAVFCNDEYLKATKDEYQILKDNSKRMKTIYESILKKYN
jgi:hypothetical protein